MLLRQGANTYDSSVAPTRRAFLPPASAWASGTYTWAVVARDREGRTRTTPRRSYVVRAQHFATVLGGTFAGDGRTLSGSIRYRTNSRTLTSRIVIKRGAKVLYAGRVTSRRGHLAGSRSPRSATFAYRARLSSVVRPGTRLTMLVKLTGGGSTRTEHWTLRVR